MLLLKAMSSDQQFGDVLAYRDIVGQAKGMLMERFGIGAIADSGHSSGLLSRRAPIAHVNRQRARFSGKPCVSGDFATTLGGVLFRTMGPGLGASIVLVRFCGPRRGR